MVQKFKANYPLPCFNKTALLFFSCYACPFSNKATTTSKQFKKCSSGCPKATESLKPSKYGKY